MFVAVLFAVTVCSPKTGGVEALAYWRNGRSGSDHPISWEHLLEKVSSGGEGEMAVDDLKREVLKWPSWSVSQGGENVHIHICRCELIMDTAGAVCLKRTLEYIELNKEIDMDTCTTRTHL